MKTAVFTIVSKNYLGFARTLLSSVEKNHPDWDRYVLLVDKIEENLLTDKDHFDLVEMSQLDLPDIDKMIFRYTILELNTAVKPWMFYWLFNNKHYDNVIYLDPDIYVYDGLTEVMDHLKNNKLMVLTPHLTGQLNDDKKPTELDIMRSGVYNLGFLAVSRCEHTNTFLNWWKDKLEYECVVDLEKGLFVDQKWMDFAPSMFKNVAILRHPGYNVAYWNLNHRKVSFKDNKYYFNGERLVFFHYSGVNPSNPSEFSKHQNRYNINNIGIVQDLVKHYASEVLKNGHETSKKYKYYYNNFSNGVNINDFCRKSYRNSEFLISLCGDNPFNMVDVFVYEPVNRQDVSKGLPLVTWVMYEIWKSRNDLQKVFPDIFGSDRAVFCQWYTDSVGREYGFDDAFINPIKESMINAIKPNSIGDHQEVNHPSAESKVMNKKRFKVFLCKMFYKISWRCKPYIRNLIPKAMKQRLKTFDQNIMKEAYSLVPVDKKIESSINVSSTNDGKQKFENGINLVGYIRAETGVGESSRSAARALSAVNIPFGAINFEVGNVAQLKDSSWVHKETRDFKFNTNILHINADQMLIARDHISNNDWNDKYNIGYWAWEMPDFPDEWCNSFKVVNEVWAPSRFVAESIAEKSPVPVIRIPHCIQFARNTNIKRDYFGLPDKTFLFLCMYDVLSVQARKNPQGAINAFKSSFKPEDKTVGLVVKVNNPKGNPEEIDKLRQIIEGYSNIYLIDRTLDREEVNALINVTDSFVSLHRSEGFGLVMAEAMYFAKPVVGTCWSGNADFMNKTNSCAVDYKLVNLGVDYGPYKSYQYWAEPDIENACYYMKKLVQEREFYSEIAYKGQQTVQNEYSPIAVGNMIKKRLGYLGLV